MPIHIIFALDQDYFFGLLAAINSVLKNTSQPQRLFFHIITPPNDVTAFEAQIPAYFPEADFQFRVRPYTPNATIQEYIQAKYQPKSAKSAQALTLLYARLFLKDIFPDLGKVIFLDTDLIVLQDIAALFDSITFSRTAYFAACPHFFPAIFHFAQPWLALKELREFRQTFNAGVLFTDLSYWQDSDYEKLYRYLAWEAKHNYRLFQLNDETLLNLMFKDYIQLERKWNRCGYGNVRAVSWLLKKPLSEIGIIHWSGGHHKPWSSRYIPYAELWHRYALLKPSLA